MLWPDRSRQWRDNYLDTGSRYEAARWNMELTTAYGSMTRWTKHWCPAIAGTGGVYWPRRLTTIAVRSRMHRGSGIRRIRVTTPRCAGSRHLQTLWPDRSRRVVRTITWSNRPASSSQVGSFFYLGEPRRLRKHDHAGPTMVTRIRKHWRASLAAHGLTITASDSTKPRVLRRNIGRFRFRRLPAWAPSSPLL